MGGHAPSVPKRVNPAVFAETGEIRVDGHDRHVVLDGERDKLRVRDDIAADIELADQPSEDAGSPLRCFRYPAVWCCQPLFDDGPGVV